MMPSYLKSLPSCLAVGAITLLAGCATRQAPDRVVTAPPPVVPTRMPVPPQGASASMTVPPVGADGQRLTPNRDLTDQQAVWHMRMALNVAALSCRDATDAARLQYNQMLRTHKAVLASANSAVDAQYQARLGKDAGFAAREHANTKVYNFFALPPVQASFCQRAIAAGAAVNALNAAALPDYARQALASMEQPFLDFYDAYARYQTQMAQWRSAQTPQPSLSTTIRTVPLAAAPPQPTMAVASAPALKFDLASVAE
jgi:hypothetical protein